MLVSDELAISSKWLHQVWGKQMSLKILAASDTYDNLSCTSSLEEVRSEHLNL